MADCFVRLEDYIREWKTSAIKGMGMPDCYRDGVGVWRCLVCLKPAPCAEHMKPAEPPKPSEGDTTARAERIIS